MVKTATEKKTDKAKAEQAGNSSAAMAELASWIQGHPSTRIKVHAPRARV
jgi:hypothetical protein